MKNLLTKTLLSLLLLSTAISSSMKKEVNRTENCKKERKATQKVAEERLQRRKLSQILRKLSEAFEVAAKMTTAM